MDVDPINSVQFSNHTGYKSGFKGQVLNSQELNDLFEGLQMNNLHSSYTHLLTGYVGNDTFLRQIKEIIKRLREANPNMTYGKHFSSAFSKKFHYFFKFQFVIL